MDTLFWILVGLLPFAYAYSLYKYHKKGRLKFGIKQNIDYMRWSISLVAFAYSLVMGSILSTYIHNWVNIYIHPSSSSLGHWLIHTGFDIFVTILYYVISWKIMKWVLNVKVFSYNLHEEQWIREDKYKNRQWLKSKLSWLRIKKYGNV